MISYKRGNNMINPNEYVTLDSTLPFFKDLDDKDKNLIIENTKLIKFKKGEILHNAEIECSGVLIIKSGKVRAYIISPEGREITLYRLEENDVCILSASCILNNINFDVFIDANTDCEVLQICPKSFSKVAQNNANAKVFMYELTNERFSEVMWTIEQILFTSFDKRLASFLIDESYEANSDTLSITHEDIAKILGSAREVVSRMLKYFSKEGYVTLSRGKIKITKKDELLKLTK